MEQHAAAGIHGPGSPELARLEADVARFLERDYRRQTDCPSRAPIVTDTGPILAEAASLMARHYDADLSLFAAFLDPHYMAYSMGWYGDEPEAIRASNASLHQAQKAKLALAVERSGIVGDQHILDLGCGFGCLETFLAETRPGVKVTALTASRTQADYIEACRRDPNHPLSSLDLRLIRADFGTISEEELGVSAYDGFVSIAVFEQAHNLRAAFSKIARLLRPGGRAFLHFITSRVTIPRLLDADRSLTARYFPGGRVWPYQIITQHTAPLELESSWFISGLNYWRTLEAWHQAFWLNLSSMYPGALDVEGVQHWNQYFSLCKACFTPMNGDTVGVGHFLLRKPA